MKQATSPITLAQTLKSKDTEETLDLLFYRPLGFQLARLSARCGITPNAITILSIVIGVAAALFFYPTSMTYNLIGVGCLVFANLLDSVDGQLARMTGNFSRWGRILDGAAGDFWFIAIYTSICCRLIPQWHGYIFLLGAVAGFLHSRQATLADRYRNVHLHYAFGKGELTNSEEVRTLYESLTWRKNFLYKLAQRFYLNYNLSQESLTPNLQQLRGVVKSHYGDTPPTWFREAFRAKSLPLMKYTNILTFNTRALTLFASILMDVPWLYFVVEIAVLQPLFIYMRRTHERFSKAFVAEIAQKSHSKLPVQGIIFDYGATLDTNGEHWSHVIWRAYQTEQIPITQAQFREAYVYGERALATHPYIEPHHTFAQLLQQKIVLQMRYLVENEMLEREWEAKSDEIAHNCYLCASKSVARAKSVLEQLAPNYPMVLVSNFYGNINTVLEEFEIAHYFKQIVESAVIKIRKPNPAIFAAGVEALGLPPHQVVVVGDSYRKDIAPALTLGCQAIWLQGEGWDESDNSATHAHTITSLEELVQWL